MSSWTGGRRRIKPKAIESKPTLFVSDPRLFARRNKVNSVIYPIEWSEQMVRDTVAKWEAICVFTTLRTLTSELELEHVEDFKKFIKGLGINSITVTTSDSKNVEVATKEIKECIINLGGRFRPPKNPREVTYINARRYFDAPHITFVGMNGHKKVGIEIEKERSFNDCQKLRKKRSSW